MSSALSLSHILCGLLGHAEDVVSEACYLRPTPVSFQVPRVREGATPRLTIRQHSIAGVVTRSHRCRRCGTVRSSMDSLPAPAVDIPLYSKDDLETTL